MEQGLAFNPVNDDTTNSPGAHYSETLLAMGYGPDSMIARIARTHASETRSGMESSAYGSSLSTGHSGIRFGEEEDDYEFAVDQDHDDASNIAGAHTPTDFLEMETRGYGTSLSTIEEVEEEEQELVNTKPELRDIALLKRVKRSCFTVQDTKKEKFAVDLDHERTPKIAGAHASKALSVMGIDEYGSNFLLVEQVEEERELLDTETALHDFEGSHCTIQDAKEDKVGLEAQLAETSLDLGIEESATRSFNGENIEATSEVNLTGASSGPGLGDFYANTSILEEGAAMTEGYLTGAALALEVKNFSPHTTDEHETAIQSEAQSSTGEQSGLQKSTSRLSILKLAPLTANDATLDSPTTKRVSGIRQTSVTFAPELDEYTFKPRSRVTSHTTAQKRLVHYATNPSRLRRSWRCLKRRMRGLNLDLIYEWFAELRRLYVLGARGVSEMMMGADVAAGYAPIFSIYAMG